MKKTAKPTIRSLLGEDAFNAVKRLLGLAYFAVGSVNGIQTQLRRTWTLYALVMVYRGLYHFIQAQKRGEADHSVRFLAQDDKLLAIVKQNCPKSLDAPHLLTVQLKA